MRKLKKVMLVLMVAITLCTMCTPMASAAYYDLPYTYTFDDGTQVKYNFDADGNSYGFIDGEKVDLALPLDCYEVTDPEILAKLNAGIENTNTSSMARVAPPTNYYTFKIGSNELVSSNTYTQKVDYSTISLDVDTSYLKPYPGHNYIVLKTTNLKTANILSNKKINYSFWYYEVGTEKWYGKTYTKSCTSGVPHAYLTTYDYIQFTFIKSSNIKSFTANIWTKA